MWWRTTTAVSSMRENLNLTNYQQLQVGDYFINPVDDNFSNLLFVVQATDDIKIENEIASVKIQISSTQQATVILGDGANRLFFAKHTSANKNLNLPFISKKILELDQNTKGKTFVMTIPLYSERLKQYAQSSDCVEYCQDNIRKIKKFNSMYLRALIGKGNSPHFLSSLSTSATIGPVVQLVELE